LAQQLEKDKSTFLGVNSMSTIQHSAVTGSDLHGIVAFSVASVAARNALSVVAGDVGKVAQVTADNTFYVLTAVSPAVWTAMTPALATVATSGAYSDLSGTPTIPSAYTLPVATASVLGGVKAGSGVTIDGAGVISAAGTYTLPTASGSTLGGVKVGTGLAIDGSGVLSSTVSSGASLSAANTWTAGQRGAVTALTAGATVTPDFAASNNFSLTANQAFTLANPTNQVAGQSGIIAIKQDATGSRVISWGANFVAAGGTKPVLTTTANATDYLSYYVESNGRIFVSITSDVK
jgi:hypothetical protein